MQIGTGKFLFASILAVTLSVLTFACPAPIHAQEAPPPGVFIDRGACPFECCTYREWFAARDITLWDRPNGKRVVAQLHKDEPVDGLTGEVHSIPLRAKANADFPEVELKAGDVFYVIHYSGEGVWKIWHHGQVVELEVTDESVRTAAPPPESWPQSVKRTWWVRVRTRQGLEGWAVSHGNFRHQDACG
jgi:hypothetical protein